MAIASNKYNWNDETALLFYTLGSVLNLTKELENFHK